MLHDAIQVLNVVQGNVATRRRKAERAAAKAARRKLERDAAEAKRVAARAVVAETRSRGRAGGLFFPGPFSPRGRGGGDALAPRRRRVSSAASTRPPLRGVVAFPR